MYNEISCVARAKNNVAKSVLIGLVGSSLIFVAAAYMTPVLSGIVWMVAFIFIVASLYVYNRYVGAEFCYSIENVGVPSLIVTQRVGKTVKTMARLDVDSLTELRLLSGEEYRKHKCAKGVMRYSYFPTMRPSEVYLVSMRSRYEDADVFIEIDDRFASALRQLMEQTRSDYEF